MDEACFIGVMARLEGSPYATLFQGADALSAVNDASLLNGNITIADANAKKIEIVQKFLNDLTTLQQQLTAQFQQAHNTEVVVRSNNQAVSSVAAQNAINSMNTATQIRQSQTTQQLLQQNQYRVPAPCLGFNCR
jgi:polyribonucleotide nucleotidyltransferase